MSRKNKAWQPPAIDGRMEYGNTYQAYSSKLTSKEQAANYFRRRFGYDPETVFFGKPNGTMVYAGPILNKDKEK